MLSPHQFIPEGGGYVPSPNMESPSMKGGSKSSADQNTVTPVTVLMLWNVESTMDDTFRYNGHPLVQITFVGQVLDIDESASTNITYKIFDGTDTIDVKVWLETDDAGNRINVDDVKINSWVRVYGNLRKFHGSLNVAGLRVLVIPQERLDEVTFHFLEVIRVFLYQSKGLVVRPAAASSHGIGSSQASMMGGQQSRNADFNAPGIFGGETYGHKFSELEQKVLQILNNPMHKLRGLDVKSITAQCGDYPPASVQKVISELHSCGHVLALGGDRFKST